MEYFRMQLTDMPASVLVAMAVFSLCSTTLLMMLLFAPRKDCFYLRWRPETRFLALMISPSLLILWPLVLVWWMIKHGMISSDSDFYDD